MTPVVGHVVARLPLVDTPCRGLVSSLKIARLTLDSIELGGYAYAAVAWIIISAFTEQTHNFPTIRKYVR